jgi:hypothetical protein
MAGETCHSFCPARIPGYLIGRLLMEKFCNRSGTDSGWSATLTLGLLQVCP